MIDDPDVLSRFEGSLEIVDGIARKLARVIGSLVEYEDLVSAGREGLLSAARRFEPERGVPFRAFASYRIRGAILDGVRRAGPLPRQTYERLVATGRASDARKVLADHAFARDPLTSDAESDAGAEDARANHRSNVEPGLGTMIAQIREEMAATEVEADPEQVFARTELIDLLRAALHGLKPDESEIVRRHYFDDQTLEEIAKAINISSSWASRLHTRGVAALTKKIRRSV